MTVVLIVLVVWAAAVTIMLGLCSAASAGDRRLLAADDVDTTEFPAVAEPTPAQRAAAWDADDPAELRRAAREWRRIGATDYAASLEAQAAGESYPIVARPW